MGDGQGCSLVDTTLTNLYEYDDPDRGLNTALFLINHGVDNQQDKANVLCDACERGNLDVVKELVEQHNVDPNGEYYDCAPLHCLGLHPCSTHYKLLYTTIEALNLHCA